MREKIAVGHVHVIVGEPGVGISPVLVNWGARVSTGKQWPADFGENCVGDVVFVDTTGMPEVERYRWFAAADAAIARVHVLTVDYKAEVRVALSKLAAKINELKGVRLLVIDDFDSWRMESRIEKGKAVFSPQEFFRELKRFALRLKIAVVVAAKVSIADASASREIEALMHLPSVSTVFRVTRGEDDVRELAVVRSRIGSDCDVVPFRVKTDDVDGESVPVVSWFKRGYRLRPGEDNRSRKKRVIQLVAAKLYDGMPSTEVDALRNEAGYSKITLYRIVRDLGWARKKVGKKWVIRPPQPKKRAA